MFEFIIDRFEGGGLENSFKVEDLLENFVHHGRS